MKGSITVSQITSEHIKEFELGKSLSGLFVEGLLGEDNELEFTEAQQEYILDFFFDVIQHESDLLYGLTLNVADAMKDAPKDSLEHLDVDELCIYALKKMKIGKY